MGKIDKLNKDIDELSTPTGKLLVRALIFSIVVIFPLFHWVTVQRMDDCKAESRRKDTIIMKKNAVIDTLTVTIMREKDKRAEDYENMVEWQKEVKQYLKSKGL